MNEEFESLDFGTTEEELVEYSSLWETILMITCLLSLLGIEWTVRKLKNMP